MSLDDTVSTTPDQAPAVTSPTITSGVATLPVYQASADQWRSLELNDTVCVLTLGQLSAELTGASSIKEVAEAVLRTVQQCAQPAGLQINWALGDGYTQTYGQHPVALPSLAIRTTLATGQLVIDSADDQLTIWAPFLSNQQLAGWMVVINPANWSPRLYTLLGAVTGQAALAFQMATMTSRQAEQRVQLDTLALVGQHVSGVLDLNQIYLALYQAVAQLIHQDVFYIALYDPDTAMFESVYTVVSGEERYIHERWSQHLGLGAVIIRDRLPICTENYLAECTRRGIAPAGMSDIHYGYAWLGVPLIARDTIIGIMTLSSQKSGYQYHQEDVDLLMTIAGQGAIAIENARLYRRSEQQSHQLETLNRIGRTITSWLDFDQVPAAIMDQVTDLLEVEEGSLLLTDETSGDLYFAYTTGPFGSKLRGQRLARGAGVAGYVATIGQSVIVNDVQHDARFDASNDQSTGYTTRRLMAVPLRGMSGIQGVIEVLNRRDNTPFSDADRRLLEALADYAVIAIENARRFAEVDQALSRRAQELARINNQLQHNLRSLTALNALGMAITTSLRNADEIYRLTSRGIVEITEALAAWVVRRQGMQWQIMVATGPLPGEDPGLDSVFQRVITNGRPEILDGTLSIPLQRMGIHSLMVVPLRAARETLGCLVIAFADKLPDASDRETIMLFATQASSAVESLELFSAISSARDQMGSIMASTREGMLLIDSDGRVAIMNARFSELCEFHVIFEPGTAWETVFGAWGAAANYDAEGWRTLESGLKAVLDQQAGMRTGQITREHGQHQALEWAALAAMASGDSQGGALLVLRDITDARESERLRQDLTHMIVHDLRSPLSSVMASIEMLTRGVSGDLNSSQKHVLNIASDSAEQMLEMINTLLDISRLEAGRMPLSIGSVELYPIIQRVAEQFHSLAQERRITITTDCDPGLPTLTADSALVTRVIQNLVVNAIKFSSRRTTITITAEQTASDVRVHVQDQGVGIAPRDLERIFTKFGQVGERRGGTGLGLTFCRLVIDAHGGRIWVESQIGCGSTFSFALPRA